LSTRNGAGLASEQLRGLVQPRLSAVASAYFDGALARSPLAPLDVLAAFSAAGRRAGGAEVQLSGEQLSSLSACALALPALTPLSLLVRAYLLLEGCQRLPAEQHVEFVTRAFRTGGNEERCAVLYTLAALPDPARFALLAVDACRTHVLGVFEALACDNVYPERYFDQPSFNQMVVKALFMGSPLGRIEGLSRRNNEELRRMVRDYAQERRAAGRSVPADAKLVDADLVEARGSARERKEVDP
jgi:hypothetical protein